MHPSGTAWQKHVRGLASLIEERGPQGFQSPRSLQLVAFLRMLVVSTAIPLSTTTGVVSQPTAPVARSHLLKAPHFSLSRRLASFSRLLARLCGLSRSIYHPVGRCSRP